MNKASLFVKSMMRRRSIRFLVASVFATLVLFLVTHKSTNVQNYYQHLVYSENSPYLIDWDAEREVDPSYKEEPLFSSSGKLNMAFFKKFKFHKDLTPEAVLKWNNKLYNSVMYHKISEPKGMKLVRPEVHYERTNATLMSLVRNSELDGLISSMRQVEKHFNNKFQYPWTFMNNRPFSEEFKSRVKQETSAQVYFVEIPGDLWDLPKDIDNKKMRKAMKKLAKQGLPYAKMTSYRNMCRFNSGNFYNVPHMQQFKWYWRVEPDVDYFCDIDYDVFKFMEDNNKTYGFVTTLYEIAETIPTLWSTTLEFIEANPQFVHKNGAFDWLLNDNQLPDKAKMAQGYSTCHFWSNFEIGNMDFFRGEAYSSWFKHLESKGGFYYERWGDAPVHSVGLALFEDKEKIHWFRDIGYHHPPYKHCPLSDKCSGCQVAQFTIHDHLQDQNCNPHWIRYSMNNQLLEQY